MSKNGSHSIARRWLINSLGIILVILLILNVTFAYAIRNYYYSSASQSVSSSLNVVSSVLKRYAGDTTKNFSAEVRNYVENFERKSTMELMAVNIYGNVVVTSSGFSPTGAEAMPDYVDALHSSSQTGYYTGTIATGEKVFAMSVLMPKTSTKFSAMRLVVSLEAVDSQIRSLIFWVSMASLGVLFILLLSGLYFVRSIIIPIRQIGTTARRLAVGDFSVRIKKEHSDEIGELCDIINYMADELANADAVKNDFISSVSHELRTPLTAIKGWAETLTDLDDPQTVHKGMRVITNEAERLSGMVEELLDFSRIQNGKFTLFKTNMDILAELGEAVLIYQERAKREGIEIIYNEPELLPVIYGDKNRIRQVFINIIDNAIKYSDEGGTVTVEASVKGDDIEVTISDTGCGISPSDLPRIKTKFYKANHSRRGSGIGLAVAEEIISMHGGMLFIDSELGVGTTVTVAFPAGKKAEQRTAEFAAIQEKEYLHGEKDIGSL